MNFVFSAVVLSLFLVDHFIVYITKTNECLSERQRAYVLSIKTAITLFGVSLYFNYRFMTAGLFNLESIASDSNEAFLANLAIIFFISHLLSDTFYGYLEYPNYMNNLSGYIHHAVYIVLSVICLVTNRSSILLLFMISEFSTIFLSLGQYRREMRYDTLFGISFFVLRILYHGFLTYYFRTDKMVFGAALSIWILHIYWFVNWLKKYGH